MIRAFLFLLVSLLPLFAFGGERVVSLSPALSEVIHYLGRDAELVGVTVFCDEDFCRGKERVGGIVNPSIEKVISLRPTLVVCTTMTPKRLCESFKRLGIKTERFRLVSLEDLYGVMETLARELSAPPKVSPFKRELEQELRALKPCLKGKRLFIALSVKPLYCAGRSSYLGGLLEEAGAQVFPDGSFRAVSREFLLALKPSLIISFGGCSAFKGFECIDVSPFKSDLLHPSPRLLKGLRELREGLCSR